MNQVISAGHRARDPFYGIRRVPCRRDRLSMMIRTGKFRPASTLPTGSPHRPRHRHHRRHLRGPKLTMNCRSNVGRVYVEGVSIYPAQFQTHSLTVKESIAGLDPPAGPGGATGLIRGLLCANTLSCRDECVLQPRIMKIVKSPVRVIMQLGGPFPAPVADRQTSFLSQFHTWSNR